MAISEEVLVGRIMMAIKSLFTKDGRNLLKRAIHNYVSIPLFKVQSHFSHSRIPAPALVYIEPTNRCNINCMVCARRYWDSKANPLGDMTFDFFKKHILVHLKPFQTVNLQCFGEPLLSKDFLPILKACKALGCRTTFTMKGVVLRKYADSVVSIGADELTVSIDGVETTGKIRNFSIDKVLDVVQSGDSHTLLFMTHYDFVSPTFRSLFNR